MARIDAFLQLGREQAASDIHLAVGVPPMIRINGDLIPVKYRELGADELQGLVYEIINEAQKAIYESGQDLDFSYASPEAGGFRVNLFRKVTGIGATFRVIPKDIPTLKMLGLPPVVEKLTHYRQGLILVTGATGTGKSTTLAAMIHHINTHRAQNIITLEDPIEFIHHSAESLVVQREMGSHVTSFADGLRSALREDPDIILVGEMRDLDTIMLAMMAAETGHLVLGTLHTGGAVKTLDRIIDALPLERKEEGVTSLAQNLRAVISQSLVKTVDGRGRKAILEIMLMTPAISNMLQTGKVHQIASQLELGRDKEMQTMDQALMAALSAKEIDPDDAYLNAVDKRHFQRFVSDPTLLPQVSLVGQ